MANIKAERFTQIPSWFRDTLLTAMIAVGSFTRCQMELINLKLVVIVAEAVLEERIIR